MDRVLVAQRAPKDAFAKEWCRFVLLPCIAVIVLIALTPIFGEAACPDPTNSAGYVRAGATGSGNGADWTNAYTALPASLSRGCTYYVAAGTYAAHNFNDAVSGSTLITVQAPTAAAHGTDTGWNNAYVGQATFACSSACNDILTFSSSYYVIDGVYRTDWTSGYGFHASNTNGKAGVAVIGNAGNTVHDITIAYTDTEGSHPTSDSSPGVGTYSMDWEQGSWDLLFDHDYVHDGYTAFFIKAGRDSTHAIGKNITIQYSYLKHTYSSATYHGELCSCDEGLSNFAIRYNYLVDGITHDNGTGYIATASGGGYQSGNQYNGPWYIYGNLMGIQVDGETVGDATIDFFDVSFNPGGDVWIVNNTYFNLGNAGFASGYAFGSGWVAQMSGVYIANEVWYYSRNWVEGANGGTFTHNTFASDYNQYYQMNDSPFRGDGGAHSVITPSSNPFTNASGFDFTLASDTSAGCNLSCLATLTGVDPTTTTYWNGTSMVANTFNVDMNGTVRGSTGTWDRGAFQLGSGSSSSSPNPPINVTVAVQ